MLMHKVELGMICLIVLVHKVVIDCGPKLFQLDVRSFDGLIVRSINRRVARLLPGGSWRNLFESACA